jgi:ABC-type Mn2+/Zn2+ transport system permease subunit
VGARPFLLLCFSPEQAQVSGFSARFYHNLMLAMIALAVIISFQTVGTMLVFGMLLAPAGAAALLAKRMKTMMIYASLIGMVSVYSGLLISYYFNLAAGSAIVLVAVVIFFAVMLIKNLQAASLRKGALSHD